MMKVLVAGGAGYIGSHTSVVLLENGYDVVIADNFCNSSPDIIDKIKRITEKRPKIYECDVCDHSALEVIFEEERKTAKFDCVIHFAGYKAVGESVSEPLKYYQNNIDSTLNLLNVMNEYNVKNLVFSSSAAVYSTDKLADLLKENTGGITEDFPLGSTNPYGMTKLIIENILRDVFEADKTWNIGILRYFNPIGAHPSGLIGENPKGIPNNLLPYIAKVASGELPYLNVYGDDYDTPDGTCIRDYIHVMDLAEGHIAMLNNLNGLSVYNLGTGRGYSVLDMVKTFEKVNNIEVPYKISKRRNGDIAVSFANSEKAKIELKWSAHKDITSMCGDAWNFMNNGNC